MSDPIISAHDPIPFARRVPEPTLLAAPAGTTYETRVNDPAAPGTLRWVRVTLLARAAVDLENGAVGRWATYEGRELVVTAQSLRTVAP